MTSASIGQNFGKSFFLQKCCFNLDFWSWIAQKWPPPLQVDRKWGVVCKNWPSRTIFMSFRYPPWPPNRRKKTIFSWNAKNRGNIYHRFRDFWKNRGGKFAPSPPRIGLIDYTLMHLITLQCIRRNSQRPSHQLAIKWRWGISPARFL